MASKSTDVKALPYAVAGLLLVAAALPVGSWLIMLFVAPPDPRFSALDSAIQQLQFTFSSANPDKLWFIWWAVLPAMLIVLAVAYLSRLSRQPKGAIGLFALATTVTLTSVYFSPVFVLFMLAPLFFSFLWVRANVRKAGHS